MLPKAAITLWILNLLAACLLPAQHPPNWVWRNPLPHANELVDIVYGHSGFVAVAVRGGIYHSAEGNTWSLAKAIEGGFGSRFLQATAYGNGVYVVVGGRNTILWSENGLDWQLASPPPKYHLRDVVWGADRFVAVGYEGTLLTSTDGREWNQPEFLSAPFDLRIIAFGNGTFRAGSVQGSTFLSKDGIHWERGPGGNAYAMFTVDRFYALEGGTHPPEVRFSFDGVNWEPSNNSFFPLFAAQLPDERIVRIAFVSGGRIYSSEDGEAWILSRDRGPRGENIYAVAYRANRFVAVGQEGFVSHSLDGRTWIDRRTGPTTRLSGVCAFDGKLVVVGHHGTIMTSCDGIEWEWQTVPDARGLNSVAASADHVVAVGTTILVSPDALNWHNLGLFDPVLRSVAYGNGRFVAVGDDGSVVTSTDAFDWTTVETVPSKDLSTVIYHSGRFLFSGEDSFIFATMDGKEFQLISQLAGRRISDISVGNGRLLAVGSGTRSTFSSGTVAISGDGQHWEQRDFEGLGELRFSFYHEGMYTLGGGSHQWISPDGRNWELVDTSLFSGVLEVLAVDGFVIGVGFDGTILTMGEYRSAIIPWCNSISIEDGWRYSEWFGLFYPIDGWIFHEFHRFLYTEGRTESNLWIWDSRIGWFWTSKETYPSVYRSEESIWLWYLNESSDPRFFYDLQQGNWRAF